MNHAIEDRDDLIDWLLRECECVHRTGIIHTREEAEELMAKEAADLAAEQRKEGGAA